jgi:hypothetical protein
MVLKAVVVAVTACVATEVVVFPEEILYPRMVPKAREINATLITIATTNAVFMCDLDHG